jgi:chemotaxis protein CheX
VTPAVTEKENSLKLYIVSNGSTERVQRFKRFAATKTTFQMNEYDSTSLADSNVLSEGISGVVVFDDGEFNIFECVAKVRSQTRYLSIPMVVVSGRPFKEAQPRLMAAGASTVCDQDSSDEQVLKEVEARSNTQPVIEEIKNNLLRPFTLAATVTFQEMTQTEITVQSIYQKSNHTMFGDVSALISLKMKTEGAMVLSFPEPSAVALTQRILAGVTDKPTGDMARDCIGEIANIIVGQAKGILSAGPYNFSMSTPAIVSGTMHGIWYRPNMPCLVVVFKSEFGEFALQLCLNF